MITSSKFFSKSFFQQEQLSQELSPNQICPWNLSPSKIISKQKSQLSPISKDRYSLSVNLCEKGPATSRNSSIKQGQKKLKVRSFLQKSRFLPPIEDPEAHKQEVESPQKYKTIEQKLKPILEKQNIRYKDTLDDMIKIRKHKRKIHVFPEVTLNQYVELKAKGSGLISLSSIQEILKNRRSRNKMLEEFSSGINLKNLKKLKRAVNLSNKSQTIETDRYKNVLTGRYVCAVKNPQFRVDGTSTTKFIHEY